MAFIPSSGSVVAFQGTVPFSVIGIQTGSVISISQGSVATVIIGGSIAASFTPPANQSVSGAVSVSNFPTTQNVSGSVVATQGTNPWTVVSSIAGGIFPISGSVAATIVGTPNVNTAGSVVAFQGGAPWAHTNVGSIITVGQSSIAVAIISGSIAATFTPPANQSVSGVVMAQGKDAPVASVTGNPVYVGGTDANGSIVGAKAVSVLSAPSGQALLITGSVSGTMGASIIGQLPAGTAVLGSIAALQGTNPWITGVAGSVATVIIGGSIAASFTPPANQSVSGTVQTVIIGGSIATATTNSSVMLLTGTNMVGSVAAYQGSIPWTISSVYGNISGSVIAFVTNNPSVSGTVGASVIGIAPVTLTANTIPATASILVGVTANTNGSTLTTTGYPQALIQVTSGPGASIAAALNFEGTLDGTQYVAIQGYNVATGAISSMATAEGDWAFNTAGFQGIRSRVSNWTVGSITARAVVSPSDARPFSQVVVGNPSVSGTLGASIIGQLPAGVAMLGSVAAYQGVIPWTISSVYGNISGSVVAFQGTSPWIGTFSNSSILTVPVGSTITLLQSPSIVGTYSVAATYAAVNKAIAVMGIRNDTLASIASADLEYTMAAIGPAGENVVANAPLTKWVQGTADFRQGNAGASILVIANGTASVFQYVTAVQIANMGSASVLVTLASGGSILGYSIAPAGGGSNIYYPNGLKTPGSFGMAASISGIASVLVSAQGFTSKT